MNAETNLPTRLDLEALCDGRNRAIQHWLDSYDAFHLHEQAARAACIGAAGLALNIPHGHSHEDSELARAFVAFGQFEGRDPKTGYYRKTEARHEFERLITKHVDERCWRDLLNRLGFDALLDREARKAFEDGLEGTPPVFSAENCAATFGDIWANRREYFLRSIANAFMALDRRFRSHDGFKVGARLIIDWALSPDSGWWRDYNRRDTLYDVEKIFFELEGKYPTGRDAGIAKAVEEAAQLAHRMNDFPQVVRNDYFRVRIFKNGNLHIWFENAELLRNVNLLLAEYYGEVIGDGYNETQADEKVQYHVTPAKNHGAFMSSPEVAAKAVERAGCYNQRVLEPNAGTGMLAKAASDRGCEVVCVELQKGMAHELAERGFKTYCGDFLQMKPSQLGQFDHVIMNPPFDRGRDCDHVMHAWQFVKPGGRLTAIMSARAEHAEDARHKALHKLIASAVTERYNRGPWQDLPAGSFAHAGTNVNTVILSITKPAD